MMISSVGMQKGKTMYDTCDDNRFELIDKYKKQLIESTNVEDSPDEMSVIDTILFRFYQLGWLEKLERVRDGDRWVPIFDEDESRCPACGKELYYPETKGYNFCPYCGNYNGNTAVKDDQFERKDVDS